MSVSMDSYCIQCILRRNAELVGPLGSAEKARQLMVCRFALDSCAAALCVTRSKFIRGYTSLSYLQILLHRLAFGGRTLYCCIV